MSQKTNPISLRLQKSNKHFESSWYSDLFYDQVLGDELRLRAYIEGLFFQTGCSKTLPSIQSQYKRYSTLLFFLDQRAERHKREFSLKLSREPIEHALSPRLKFFYSKKDNYPAVLGGLYFNRVKKILSQSGFLQGNMSLPKGLKNNPGVQKSSINKVSADSFTKSNRYMQSPVIPSILIKGSSHKEEVTLKASAFALCQAQFQLGLYNVCKKTYNSPERPLVDVEPKRNIKIIPTQGEFHENLFRRLILDRHSQSIQNRLPFLLVRCLGKQRACPNTPSIGERVLYKRLGTSSGVALLERTDTRERNIACLVPQNWRSNSKGYVHYTELFLNLFSGKFRYHTLCPVRAISPYQGCGFLIESVAYLLRRKSTFRQIKDEIFRELERSQLVKGARLSCAGRLGGRSKKAQKAKTQSAQWGETSLTVFSSRLAFSSKGVNTTFGKVGVKLWLCYK